MDSSYDGLWGEYSNESSSTSAGYTAPTRTANDSLDKNAFLNLLVTQFKYQDPLNPVDDKEFLAQMAQFTALEQMQNMNTTTSKSQAFSLVGKNVVAETYNADTLTWSSEEGYVHAVTMKNGDPYLMIGAVDADLEDLVEIALDDVTHVYDTYSTAAQIERMNSIYNSVLTGQNLSLVGKYVQAITSDGEESAFIEGPVEYVKIVGGQTVLVVDGKEVFAGEVISIGTEKMLLGEEVTISEKDEETNDYIDKVTGAVSDVKIKDKTAYLVIEGKEYKIDAINYVTEAIRATGKTASEGKISGEITGTVIYDGKTYLRVQTAEDKTELLLYSKVRETIK